LFRPEQEVVSPKRNKLLSILIKCREPKPNYSRKIFFRTKKNQNILAQKLQSAIIALTCRGGLAGKSSSRPEKKRLASKKQVCAYVHMCEVDNVVVQIRGEKRRTKCSPNQILSNLSTQLFGEINCPEIWVTYFCLFHQILRR
jgi:hypothetical protein